LKCYELPVVPHIVRRQVLFEKSPRLRPLSP